LSILLSIIFQGGEGSLILIARGEDDTANFGKDEMSPLFCGCGEGNRNSPIYGLYSKENQSEESFIISRDNLMQEMSVGRKTNLTIYPCVGYESTYVSDNYTNVKWQDIHYSHERSDCYLLYLKNLMHGKETGNNYQTIQSQAQNQNQNQNQIQNSKNEKSGNISKPKFIYEEQNDEFFEQNILHRAEGKRGKDGKQQIDHKNENDNTDTEIDGEGIINHHKKIKNEFNSHFNVITDDRDIIENGKIKSKNENKNENKNGIINGNGNKSKNKNGDINNNDIENEINNENGIEIESNYSKEERMSYISDHNNLEKIVNKNIDKTNSKTENENSENNENGENDLNGKELSRMNSATSGKKTRILPKKAYFSKLFACRFQKYSLKNSEKQDQNK
jgi:hypothetical protein